MIKCLEVGIFTNNKEFIFTNLDLDILNMRKFLWSDIKLMGYQIVNSQNQFIKDLVKEWMLIEFKGSRSPLENEKTFRVIHYLINLL